MAVYHGWSVTGERQSAGGARLAVLGLVQEAVDVTGQSGDGANSMVPQDMDYIVQSVQAVFHLRLKKHLHVQACSRNRPVYIQLIVLVSIHVFRGINVSFVYT